MAEAKLSKLYELYTRVYGNKNMVDREISRLMREGLSREEAINKLYERHRWEDSSRNSVAIREV